MSESTASGSPAPLEQRVAEILELPAGAQAAAFDRLRDEYPDERALLERWEAALAHVPVGSALDSAEAAAATLQPPERIGPYRLLGVLGEGGMGTVHLAEQREPVRRRVALKLIKLGMDTKNVLARFEAERQALAMMEHDSIARVFDGGATEDGRPYFVMELVRGLPLTDHCDTHRLSTPERLELFRRVCAGVQHAHQKGVLHRDLKPSNILVSMDQGKAVPKIIDFGLARATDHRLVEATLFTEQGQILGTLEYASPEQAELTSQDIDTRTDVYSLGVVLYELLVGHLPFSARELRGRGLLELRRQICEDDPPKPSTRLRSSSDSNDAATRRRTTTVSLFRDLRGDLDWIVMKAMEKDRNRRYGTANELAADLQRFLEHSPVEARPPSTLYRLRKLLVKRRATVATATIVFLALVAGLLVALWHRQQARESEQRALARLADVRSLVQRVLFDVDGQIAGLAGSTRAREIIVTTALEYLHRIEEDSAGDVSLQREIAVGYGKFGSVLRELGRAHGAMKSHLEAIHILEPLAARDQLVHDRDLATCKAGLAIDLTVLGRTREALKHFKEAVQLTKRLAASPLRSTEIRKELAQNHSSVAEVEIAVGRTRSALGNNQESVRILRELADEVPGDRCVRQALATSYWGLGKTQLLLGRSDEMFGAYEKALRIIKGLCAEAPDDAEFSSALSTGHTRLGNAFKTLGRLEDALRHYRRAVTIDTRLVKADPLSVRLRRNLGVCHLKVGETLAGLGRLEEALESHARQLRETTRLADLEPESVRARRDLAVSHSAMGDVQRELGRHEAALASCTASLELFQRLAAAEPGKTAAQYDLYTAHYRLASVQASLGRHGDAAGSCTTAVEIVEPLCTAQPLNTDLRASLAAGRGLLSDMQRILRLDGAAIENAKRSLDAIERCVAEDPGNEDYRESVAIGWQRLGRAYAVSGQFDRAVDSFAHGRPLAERLAADRPRNREYATRAESFLKNLAEVSYRAATADAAELTPAAKLEHLQRAEKLFRELIDRRQASIGDGPAQARERSLRLGTLKARVRRCRALIRELSRR